MTTRETVHLYDLIRKSITTGAPICVLYAHDGATSARVLTPLALTTTAAGADILSAVDSMRHAHRSFRVDRLMSAHPLD